MTPELFTPLIIFPWLSFDLYFMVMGFVLLFFNSGPLFKARNLKVLSQNNDKAVILIPTCNNCTTALNRLIPQIRAWLGKRKPLPISVIIVDSSINGTEEHILSALGLSWESDLPDRRIARVKNLTLVHLKNRKGGKSWAINQVALGLNTKYFAILDSDWELTFDEFGKVLNYLEDNDRYAYAQISWRATDGKMNFIEGLDQTSIEYRHQLENRVRIFCEIPITIHGSAAVIRTGAFCNLGGFSDCVLSEDVDLALRFLLAGQSGIGFSDLTMQQPPCNHFKQFFLQKARWAEGRSQMLKKYGGLIINSRHLTTKQKIIWLYYLAYFGRCVAFTLILILMLIGFATGNRLLIISSASTILTCLLFRVISHFITRTLHLNKIPLICRLIEPLTFYGIGLIYTYTFFKGFFTSKGVWHVVESKTYA